jgi:hypothetical protein
VWRLIIPRFIVGSSNMCRLWRRRSWRTSVPWAAAGAWDATYVRVKGAWKYPYRGVDKAGATVDFLLTATRDRKAALRFLRKAIGRHGVPEKITIDRQLQRRPCSLSRSTSTSLPTSLACLAFWRGQMAYATTQIEHTLGAQQIIPRCGMTPMTYRHVFSMRGNWCSRMLRLSSYGRKWRQLRR